MFSGSRFHEEMSRLSVKEKKLAAQKLLFPALFSLSGTGIRPLSAAGESALILSSCLPPLVTACKTKHTHVLHNSVAFLCTLNLNVGCLRTVTWPAVCARLLHPLWPASHRLVPVSADGTCLPVPAFAASTAPLHWTFQPPAPPSAFEPRKTF